MHRGESRDAATLVFKCPSCPIGITKLSGLIRHCEGPCDDAHRLDDGKMRDIIINDMLCFFRRELACPNHVILQLDFSMIERYVRLLEVEH